MKWILHWYLLLCCSWLQQLISCSSGLPLYLLLIGMRSGAPCIPDIP